MKCANVDRGCEWEGTVGTLEEHLKATCDFMPISCPKECKDDEERVQTFTRKGLAEHLEKDCPNRDYECEQCGEKGTYVSIT